MAKTKPSGFTKDFERTAVIFSSLLILAYAMHFGGRINYVFDLFSHFLNQYIVGGVILFTLLLCLKKWKLAVLCLLIALAAFVEGRVHLRYPYQFEAQKDESSSSLKVMSFNHFLYQKDYDAIGDWIKNNGSGLDFIAFIEAQKETAELGEHLKDLFPYQIHEPKHGSTGIVILSKHPFLTAQSIPFHHISYRAGFSVKITIQPENFNAPISLYIMHPPTPTTQEKWEVRNGEMEIIAHQAAQDGGNVIVMGDFNNTPFTPSFQDFMKISGLHYQSYGLLQDPSWPSGFPLPFLQIPIDHVFYSDSLTQQNKMVGPALGSDHHMILAEFSEK